MDFAEQIRQHALHLLGQGPQTHDQLNNILRLFAKYRSVLIQNTVIQACGTRVQSGPFAGMEFLPGSAEGCHVPKILGCYERELHAVVEAAVATGYDDIVSVGSAEGYYAVGLARRCPTARHFAYDANPIAQQSCTALAARNGVADRVTVRGTFAPAEFAAFRGRRAWFVIDIEGGELSLLETSPATDLSDFDFLIECHDCFQTGTSDGLARRLAETHAVRIVKQSNTAVTLPPLFDNLGHLDQLLAVWEWRSGPTPWLVAASRPRPDSPYMQAVKSQ
jgi:hypothetical protein